jgi:hypothetical protein
MASLADYARLSCLLLGGVLAVSKVFLLGGLPLFLLYSIPTRPIGRSLNWRLVICGVMSAVLAAGIMGQWSGLGYLFRLFHPEDFDGDGEPNLVSFYTSGRLGHNEAFINQEFTRTWEEAPLCGWGFAAQTLLDNGYLEFFVQGGAVALGGYLILLAGIGLLAFQEFSKRSEEGRLLLLLWIFILGAALGGPVLTINRFSTVFWVLLVVLYSVVDARRRARLHGWKRVLHPGLAGVPFRYPARARPSVDPPSTGRCRR